MTNKLLRMIMRLHINLSSFFILLMILSTSSCMCHLSSDWTCQGPIMQ